MKYGSVCSGIEAASKAWEPLGWKPAWFSEIEPFPSAVLAHHWPEVTNLGDMTKIADAVRAAVPGCQTCAECQGVIELRKKQRGS